VLNDAAPAKAQVLKNDCRRVTHGLLSVGLKLHCLNDGASFAALVDGLGGSRSVLETNSYKDSRASICLVLPPVGSARSAVLLLECIEAFTRVPIFGNAEIQVQVCSPGRLTLRHAAILAISFYLGSDRLRRYRLEELQTTFSCAASHPTGRRLVLYDADGDFDRDFEWWGGLSGIPFQPQLPIANGRSDLLIGIASRLDIENVNLVATLLMHAEHDGHWGTLGQRFQQEVEALLDQHLLSGLLDAPWVHAADPVVGHDIDFFAALQELVAYAFEEAVRIKERKFFFTRKRDIPARGSKGILAEVQTLLTAYRADIVSQSNFIPREAGHDLRSPTGVRTDRHPGDCSQSRRHTRPRVSLAESAQKTSQGSR